MTQSIYICRNINCQHFLLTTGPQTCHEDYYISLTWQFMLGNEPGPGQAYCQAKLSSFNK